MLEAQSKGRAMMAEEIHRASWRRQEVPGLQRWAGMAGVGGRGREVSMTGKDEEQGQAVVQSRR